MIYGSVCSGIEAASVAWHSLGWRAAFFSEIDPFASAVLTERWPRVPLHGDFTTINEGDYGPIDLLVGGTPCQDFSVAGLRKGLAGERGNLTIEFVHLARRLRPRWLVWENVPGILSIDGGRAFAAFLSGLGQCGYGFAYRVLDAQHFGVPQRRRRVFVVGYLGDWRPPAAVLFEPESLRGDSPPRREAGQRVARPIAGCVEGGSGYRNDADTADNLIARCDATGSNAQRYDYETETMVLSHSLRADGFDASEDGTGRGTPLIPIQYAEQLGREKRQNGMGLADDGAPMFTLERRQVHGVGYGSSVRRLLPVECERLQGFPDDWTAIEYRGKPASDGPRYRAIGNSMAVPCMRWLGERVELIQRLMADDRSAAVS